MTAPIPPGLLARQDQDRAALADLVRVARPHFAGDCADPGRCANHNVAAAAATLDPAVRDRLLRLAVLHLAVGADTAPAGTPAAPAPPTHEQGARAIADAIERPTSNGHARSMRAAIAAVLTVHSEQPAPRPGVPDPDCVGCNGTGSVHIDGLDQVRHCCCGCPICTGCEETLCAGPCTTLAVIAEALCPGLSIHKGASP